MALAQHPDQHSWQPWPQRGQDAHTRFFLDSCAYDLRSTMATPSLVSPHYHHASVPGIAASQYQSHSAAYHYPYPSPPPSTTVSSPAREDFFQRTMARSMGAQPSPSRALTYTSETKHLANFQVHQPPPGKFDGSAVEKAAAKLENTSKTIVYNETLNPANKVVFRTDVDELMRVIQIDKDEHRQARQPLTPAQSPKLGPGSAKRGRVPPKKAGEAVKQRRTDGKEKGKVKVKKHVCDGPNCNQAFVQKTHLEIHKRTHTGVRPYTCEYQGCGLTFTQRGNLRTHERRHLNQKPYQCDQCPKAFAQKGNLHAHEKTHKNLKPFVCLLDGCGTKFSQLGNLKTHQNKFHTAAIRCLTEQYKQFIETGQVPASQRELFAYFQQLYKNSNKGIKGRGKGRVVSKREPKKPSPSIKKESIPPRRPQSQSAAAVAAPPTDVVRNEFHGNVQMPDYTIAPGPAPTPAVNYHHVPRSYEHPVSPSIFEPAPQAHPSAEGMWYEDQSRPMDFQHRLY